MKLLGRDKLQSLLGLDEQTDKWIRGWMSEVVNANWKDPLDVLHQFPHAKRASSGIFHFRVASQPKLIEVSMTFPKATAIVIDLKNTNL
jgi:hypothetical protein